ncbi:MAG: YciI family protein [Microlunatus sp.]|nr:YciI family protein [Microlunatus sp.]
MRVLACMMGNEESEAGTLPPPELFEEMGRFNEQLVNAGVLLAADGLRPTSAGAKVKWTGSGPTVIDGPFTEAKELVAGFWIVEVGSLAEAEEWFKRCPCGEGAEIQLRPIQELEDLAGAMSPETLELNARLRNQGASGAE